MSSSLLAPIHLKDHWHMVEAGAASAGREADRREWRIGRDIFVAETSALARDRARQVLGRNYVRHQLPNRYGSRQMAATKIDPSMPDEAVDVDYMMEHMWIVGDPQECADRIRQLYPPFRITQVSLSHFWVPIQSLCKGGDYATLVPS